LFEHRVINLHISLGILDLAEFSKKNGLSVKREIERFGTRYVLQQLLNLEDDILEYDSNNKPFLKNRLEHISISHSHDKLAVIVNKLQATGIDIELIRDKVKNIQYKFLSEKELHFAKDDVDKLLTIWAAKEALYKVYGKKELEFILHIEVENFSDSKIYGSINTEHFKKKFELVAENVDNYRMVYVLNEI